MKITFQVFTYLSINLSHSSLALYNASHLSPPTVIQKDTIIAGCAIKVPFVLGLPKSLLWTPAYIRRADMFNISTVLQSVQLFETKLQNLSMLLCLFGSQIHSGSVKRRNLKPWPSNQLVQNPPHQQSRKTQPKVNSVFKILSTKQERWKLMR